MSGFRDYLDSLKYKWTPSRNPDEWPRPVAPFVRQMLCDPRTSPAQATILYDEMTKELDWLTESCRADGLGEDMIAIVVQRWQES